MVLDMSARHVDETPGPDLSLKNGDKHADRRNLATDIAIDISLRRYRKFSFCRVIFFCVLFFSCVGLIEIDRPHFFKNKVLV